MESLRLLLSIVIVIPLSSCVYLQIPGKQLESSYYQFNQGNNKLIILLPGISDNAKDFEQSGIIERLKECQPNANILYIDTHFGYYREKKIIKRLHHDIILPAKAQGVNSIWMFGISLGGLGSLSYRMKYPENIRGVLTIAPFLGLASDFKKYQKGKDSQLYLKEFIPLWNTLQQNASQTPPIYLAFGTEDTYKNQQDWLGNLLPIHQVIEKKGKHDWKSWNNLWPDLLNQSSLCSNKAT